jgi:hypothetical protein
MDWQKAKDEMLMAAIVKRVLFIYFNFLFSMSRLNDFLDVLRERFVLEQALECDMHTIAPVMA